MLKGRRNISFIILTLLLSVFVIDGFAQKKKKDKKPKKVNIKQTLYIGDQFFDQEFYNEAVAQYLIVANYDSTNAYSRYKLGESYRASLEYGEAEKWYGEADKLAHSTYPLATFWFATMQKQNGNYVEAEAAYEKFLNGFKAQTEEEKFLVDRALFEYNGCVLALDELKKPTRDYHFENLLSPINTEYSEYAPAIGANDTTIVFTSSKEGSTGNEEFKRFGDYFSDNYRYELVGGEWKEVPNSDNFNVVNSIRNDGAGIFTKDKQKYYFTQCNEIDENSEYEEHRCAIYATKLVNGKWFEPIKLNKNINPDGVDTKQPALSPGGDTIYFTAYERSGGFGQHDIWYSVAKGEDRWGPAKNMGPGVNTPFIEMSPCYHDESNTLFFASNGHEGFGGLDIFRVTDSENKIVDNVGLPFNSNRDDFYFVLGEEKGYLSSNRDSEESMGHDDIYWFDIKSHRSLIAILNKDSIDANSLTVEGKVLFADTKEPAADVDIILATKDGFALKVTSTDDNGTFRFENLDALEDYLLLLKEKDPRLTAKIEYLIENLRMKGSSMAAKKTWFENIYFDFDQYYLRPEAKKVLDELIAYLKDFPQVQIEMNACTDSFGAGWYNDKLSQRRGNAALKYLKDNGVKNSDIVINAMGEGTPIATNENPVGRQLNRRVEFFIVGGGTQSDAMTYVIEPKRTLYSIAKEFDMTVDELKELNGIKGEKIKAFRPIRVRRTGDDQIIAPTTLSTSKFNKYAYLNQTVDALPGGGDKKVGNVEFKNADDVNLDGTIKTTNTNDNSDDSNESNKDSKTSTDEINTSNSQSTMELKEGESYYEVQPLNTLYSIAKDHDMTLDELKSMNNLKSSKLYIGQKLKVKSK